MTIIPLRYWLLAIALVLSLVVPRLGMAETFTMKDAHGNSVTLLDEPCYEAPPWLGWRKARMVYRAQTYEACWRVFGNTVLILDSAGDSSPVPVSAFKKDEPT